MNNKGAKHGVRTRTKVLLNIRNDILTWLQAEPNMSEYVSKLIEEDKKKALGT